jgi:glutamate racemase
VDSSRPIGVYDSGLGGLTVVSELVSAFPNEQIIYVGDTARAPYGCREAGEIVAFSAAIVNVLVQARCKLIVVACNTSSALALPSLSTWCPIPVLGLIDSGAASAHEAVARLEKPCVGVVATEATVRSRAYERGIQALRADIRVRAVAAPGWVPLIEAGIFEGAGVQAAIGVVLGPLLNERVDALVMGCTHYPHWREALREHVGGALPLIDPASRITSRVRHALSTTGGFAKRRQTAHRFLVSGDPSRFDALARVLTPGLDVRAEPLVMPASVTDDRLTPVLQSPRYTRTGSSGIVGHSKS